jgi:hypothetical protein
MLDESACTPVAETRAFFNKFLGHFLNPDSGIRIVILTLTLSTVEGEESLHFVRSKAELHLF